MARVKCKTRDHRDTFGRSRAKCTACGDVFPCASKTCDHLDCIVATGRALPDFVEGDAYDAISSELRIMYPDLRIPPRVHNLEPDDFGAP